MKSILLKVSPDTHAEIQEAANRHQRSMQKVLVSLIESWLANGAPDPHLYIPSEAEQPPEHGTDPEARAAIDAMAEKLRNLQDIVMEIRDGQISSNPSNNPGGWLQDINATLDPAAKPKTPLRRRVLRYVGDQASRDGDASSKIPAPQDRLQGRESVQ